MCLVPWSGPPQLWCPASRSQLIGVSLWGVGVLFIGREFTVKNEVSVVDFLLMALINKAQHSIPNSVSRT